MSWYRDRTALAVGIVIGAAVVRLAVQAGQPDAVSAALVGVGGMGIAVKITATLQARKYGRLREESGAAFVGRGTIALCDDDAVLPAKVGDSFTQVKPERLGLMSAATGELDGVVWVKRGEHQATIGWVPGNRSKERGAREFWIGAEDLRIHIGHGRRPNSCELHLVTSDGQVVLRASPSDLLETALRDGGFRVSRSA